MNKKPLTNEESYDTIYHEYTRAKKKYQQSKLTKEQYYSIRAKLFNVTSASCNYVKVFKTYKEMEDDYDDVLNYRIKYKIGLHYLSGVDCEQDFDKGYRKIVDAKNLGLLDANIWINKYTKKERYGSEDAKRLLYKNEYDKLMQNLNNRYKDENYKNEYVQLGLVKYLIRKEMYNEAQACLEKIRHHHDENISAQVNTLTLELKNYETRK
ncbi:12310_t:CDS:1 [Gigaspora margarita]|uniref:12310_t:CDS:1 n=1 Tax=Gigaspora margarita TaxID=4874 RepID=A0ABN7W0M1_GIGMA|nr:12310_t:CDS:1 [Gigaspora margarita]